MFAVEGMDEITEMGRDVRDELSQEWQERRYAVGFGDDAPIRIRHKAAVLRAAGSKSDYARADEASVKSGVIPTFGQVAHSVNQKFLSMGRR